MLYHIEFTKLELFSISLQKYLLRDLDYFSTYGIVKDDILKINELLYNYKSIEDENSLRSYRLKADELRKQIKQSLKKQLGMLRNLTDYKFGYNSL